jgi:gliding motility-associated-like protein
MKTSILIITFALHTLTMLAQQFQSKFELTLPDSVAGTELKWTDFDNDGLLDALVLATKSNGDQFLLTYKTDMLQGPQWQSATSTAFKNAAIFLCDVNRDNFIDIILSGNRLGVPATHALLNQGDFTFLSEAMIHASGKVLRLADVDSDGYRELIVAQTVPDPAVVIYSHIAGSWQAVHDAIKVEATSVEVFDFDKDGDNDLFVSGKRPDHTPVTTLYDNRGHLSFQSRATLPAVEGSTCLADLDHNGSFDVVLAGKDQAGNNISMMLLNKQGNFDVKYLPVTLDNIQVLAADFNSNGLCDMHYLGVDPAGDTENIIVSDDGANTVHLPAVRLQSQAFGDFDKDGDLDLMQATEIATGVKLVVLENRTALNGAPGLPVNPIGALLYNKLFVYWQRPQDDHTPVESLTFDIGLQTSQQEWISPEFDLLSNKRLTVTHGNLGSKNYLLLPAPSSAVSYLIQSVDNSFHASGKSAGPCEICTATVAVEKIQACGREEVTLQAPANALWFSFSRGFLGESAAWHYNPTASDTVFSVTPAPGEVCAAIKLYLVEVSSTLVKKTKDTRYVCEGADVPFSVEPGWMSIAWSSHVKGFISNAPAITYRVLQHDSVTVRLSDNAGCVIERTTALVISKPPVTLNAETFQIIRGQQVQLGASGGAGYHWSPATGLRDTDVAAPIASPVEDTQYIVTVTDSLGCTANASVLVLVEGTAFVPNLFTPNNDGKNDVLKIYGLTSIKDFSFTIHNREGARVYETRDTREAAAEGWNGTTMGTIQAGGVYYWKVKGQYPSGRPLLLNGKSSGSVVLIR